MAQGDDEDIITDVQPPLEEARTMSFASAWSLASNR